MGEDTAVLFFITVDLCRVLLVTFTDEYLCVNELHNAVAYVIARMGNESAPIQLAQCWFPGLAISNAKI